MVDRFHAAGIEVILDVVYNHTAEGNQLGPTICFRGIDNASYYRLVADNPRYYMDYTGTGNTLNVRHPRTLQLIMDSLRYWILEMRVDGFRFDLASALARELHDVDRLGSFFDIISQDPVISRVKLIAEPWDVGEGGYQVGNFPPMWSEWNGKYRDTVRDYWRGAQNDARRVRLPPDRQLRPLRGHRAAAVREHQLRDRPRRLHPAATSSRTTRSTTRPTARTTATARATTGRGTCGVEGPDRRPGDQRAARAAEAQLPGHAAALPGRAHAAGGGRDRPHAAGQQQRLLPGQRDLVAGLGGRGRRPARVHPRPHRPAPRPSRLPPPALVPRAADPRQRRHRHRAGSRPTATRWARSTGRRRTRSRWACS